MQQVTMRTFVVYVEDKPGVLNRVASLFRRRAFNIDSLNVGRTHEPGVSRMTIVVEADDDTAHRFEANLYKLVNVLRVKDVSAAAMVGRNLALIKVGAGAERRAQILQLCDVFRARVVDVAPDSLIVEITGTQDKIDGLVAMMRPFGILELVQTGTIAMTRGKEQSETTLCQESDDDSTMAA
ncbi:MAG: acetolactate synthase small subunit [Polyangiaceae bacterium]|nr:acetolactate synthase small subunit [Polyangiaceae bacterium]